MTKQTAKQILREKLLKKIENDKKSGEVKKIKPKKVVKKDFVKKIKKKDSKNHIFDNFIQDCIFLLEFEIIKDHIEKINKLQ